jgi:hypothetical protein
MSDEFTLDLAAARAARAEAQQAKRTLIVDGETFTLPPAVPLETVDQMSQGELVGGILSLFGEEQGRLFLKVARPDTNDFEDIMRELYGYEAPGESSASTS